MQSRPRLLLFGFLIWLIPFVAAFFIFPLRQSNRPLFDTLMPIFLTLCTTYFSLLHVRTQGKNTWQLGLTVGMLWLLISVLLDLPFFVFGPFAMPIGDYLSDIGLTYLLIPIVTTGLTLARQ